jgi:hypothetical protein
MVSSVTQQVTFGVHQWPNIVYLVVRSGQVPQTLYNTFWIASETRPEDLSIICMDMDEASVQCVKTALTSCEASVDRGFPAAAGSMAWRTPTQSHCPQFVRNTTASRGRHLKALLTRWNILSYVAICVSLWLSIQICSYEGRMPC